METFVIFCNPPHRISKTPIITSLLRCLDSKILHIYSNKFYLFVCFTMIIYIILILESFTIAVIHYNTYCYNEIESAMK